MNLKNKIIIILIGLSLLGVTGLLIYTALGQSKEPTSGEITVHERSDPEKSNLDTLENDAIAPEVANKKISDAIIKKTPALASNGIPNFTIIKYKEPLPGWYIATVRNNSTTTEDARVILKGSISGNLTVFAGPGTYFDNVNNLPIEVKEAIFE